jgi:tetratricopeptide (TPR) repeat protein
MKYSSSPEKQISGLGRKPNSFFKIFMAMTFVALSFSSFAQSPEVRNALRLIDIEQPSKGISALEQLASASSSNQYYLGLGYLRVGDTTKAQQAFEKGVSMNEKDGLNHAGIGHVKLSQKNSTEAKTHFDKALSVSKSKKADVLKAVAQGYQVDSKYVLDAINLLNKAKTLDAADPEVHILLGDAYLMQNNGGESVSSYERAASADPKSGKANFKIAKVYQRSKNTDMVMENLNKSIAADPEYAPAYKALGEAYYVDKKANDAVAAYEKYLGITENAGQAKYQYAFFLIMAKRFDQANEIFKEVINSPNASPTALKYYAYSLLEKDTTRASAEQARPLLDQYFQKAKPEDIQGSDYAYYGKLLLELKEDSLASESFAKSLELDSAQQEIWQLHGDTYLKRKKFPEAVDAFRNLMALRKQPLSQDLWSLGRAHYFNDQYAEADSAFTQLSEKQPKVTFGYLWAAKARARLDSLGEQGSAIPMYERFIEVAQTNPEKNKKDLIEAYDYLGQYALHKKDNVLEAKSFFEKVLALDPANERAKEFMKALNSPAQQQQKGKK